MVADDKGLLAIDESIGTCNRRFAALGIPETADRRRAWRELIVTTPGLGQSISGAILCDETIRQRTGGEASFVSVLDDAGILPGIKVDAGTIELAGHPGEKITEGLDGLQARLATYAEMGARFAKWRGVIAVDADRPSRGCVEANAQALARYATICQQVGLVPVVEPEVLMEGSHDLARCAEVTEAVLRAFFRHADEQGVMLEAMILKPNMVLPGLDCANQEDADTIANATVNCLLHTVPASVPGIAFLSGGQTGELASARLNAMNLRFRGRMPWQLAFSFARAIQQPALQIWAGQDDRVQAAQAALAHRAMCNHAARRGAYDAAMELTPAAASAR
ncbi:class I fructose-bisphosphate aldolase [Bosea sp. 685]|uniref:class I fructose-bisphosphate aldolase n=1 Tax=Bosea sp. 685 TaxID=3080057 RepID=UPI002892B4A5|nr:class I fructose-bisphosphate aldolase [Bosea sp. 685]WNJ93525.1 class I fructose-bisphosphate aldolase [Bosea sp. 685]